MINQYEVYGVMAFLAWFFLQWKGKLPQVRSVTDLVLAVNSRGGNIIVLLAASTYFFEHSLRLFYVLLADSKDGKIGQDNAFALMALQFVTSTAFGGAFGALLKTMTGEGSRGRISDQDGAHGQVTMRTTQTTQTVAEKKDVATTAIPTNTELRGYP